MSTTSAYAVNSKAKRYIAFDQSFPDPETSSPFNPWGNTIRYRFPTPQRFDSCELALNQIAFWYSWFNIKASYGNNTFSIIWPTNSGTTTYTITIPDGNYEVSDLNNEMHKQMQVQGLYFINTNYNPPVNEYMIWIVANIQQYTITLNCRPLPLSGSLPVGWSLPTNYPGGSGALPSSSYYPQLVVPATAIPAGTYIKGLYSFSKYLGFPPGNWPASNVAPNQSTIYSQNAPYLPHVETTNTVSLACSIVNATAFSSTPQVFYRFAPNVSFGSLITIEPRWPVFLPIVDIVVSYIDIWLLDDEDNRLQLNDPHISGSIYIVGK